jgi:hypothetical protein
MAREARRTFREATAEENARLEQVRQEVAKELPELIRSDRLRKAAAEEDTFSGALRRAVHKHELSLDQIARRTGISEDELDDFLTGEKSLPSHVIDRLVQALGWKYAVPAEKAT